MLTSKITIVDNQSKPKLMVLKSMDIPCGVIFRGHIGTKDVGNEQGGSGRGPYLVCYSCVLDLSDSTLTWERFGQFAPHWTILEVLDAEIIIRSKQ